MTSNTSNTCCGSEDFANRVAKSKFNGMPRFAKTGKGYIALQGDHGQISFRNIKIRPIATVAEKSNSPLRPYDQRSKCNSSSANNRQQQTIRRRHPCNLTRCPESFDKARSPLPTFAAEVRIRA